MLIGLLSVLVILAVGYAYLREGIFTAFVMCCNTLLAGLVAFNFWEPLADMLDPILTGTFLAGYEDAFCLVFLFSLTLGLLRLACNSLAPTEMVYPALIHRSGGFVFGLLTGYLATGFLVCVLQTLPWHENFMYFDGNYDPTAPGAAARRILPPDRVWLALMHRAGVYPFSYQLDPTYDGATQPPADRFLTFDKYGTFSIRYLRYRRYPEGREPIPYLGELDYEVGKPL